MRGEILGGPAHPPGGVWPPTADGSIASGQQGIETNRARRGLFRSRLNLYSQGGEPLGGADQGPLCKVRPLGTTSRDKPHL